MAIVRNGGSTNHFLAKFTAASAKSLAVGAGDSNNTVLSLPDIVLYGGDALKVNVSTLEAAQTVTCNVTGVFILSSGENEDVVSL